MLSIILAESGFARAEIFSIGFPDDAGYFEVVEKVPYLLREGNFGQRGNAIDIVKETQLIHLKSKEPLCYPLDGDAPSVSLGKTKETSSAWDISKRTDRRGSPIKATEGKFKDWFLDWTDEEIEIKSGDKTYHGRKLILTKEPKTKKLFRTFPVAP